MLCLLIYHQICNTNILQRKDRLAALCPCFSKRVEWAYLKAIEVIIRHLKLEAST